ELPSCRFYLLDLEPVIGDIFLKTKLGINIDQLFKRAGVDPDDPTEQKRHVLLTYASFPSRIIESAIPRVKSDPSDKAASSPTGADDQHSSAVAQPTKPLQTPKIELEDIISRKLPALARGPVIVAALLKVKLKGSAYYGAPATKITFDIGK